MSGLEVIGIISNIISIIDAVCNVVSAYTNASGLPDAIQDVANRLPLVEEMLIRMDEYIKSNQKQRSYDAMARVLIACQDKASLLAIIFKARVVLPTTPDSSKPSRPSARKRFTTAAIMTLHVGKSRKIESLMKGIIEDIQLLTDNRALDAFDNVTRDQLRDFAAQTLMIPNVPYVDDRPRELSQSLSVPSRHTSTSPPRQYSNHGSGMQCILSGNGTQSINNGSGFFGSGPVTGGTFHYTNASAARC